MTPKKPDATNDALAKSIISSLNHHGDDAMFVILPIDDWLEILDSVDYCLEEEDLISEERAGLVRIRSLLVRKVKAFRQRTVK